MKEIQTESKRQLQVGREIQKELAELIRKRGLAFFDGALVSVSGVKVSSDLSIAKVYVSIFPSDKKEKVMQTISDNSRAFRGELGAGIGRQIRITPELNWYIDSSLDYVEHIEELLKK